MQRKKYLDGIRGMACIMVVLSHIAQLYFPYLIYGREHYIHDSWENIFTRFPLTVAYNGNSGVYIFMLIGGFVSVGVGTKINSVLGFIKKCVKRYLRLLIPISMTMLLVVVLFYTNGFLYNELDYYTFNDSIIAPAEKAIGFWEYFKYVTFSVFFDAKEFEQPILSYNHVLWTIRIEFLCSIMVYFICAFLKHDKVRIFAYALIILFLFSQKEFVSCGFFAGSILAELDNMNVKIKRELISFILLLLGGFCLGFPYVLKDTLYTLIWNFHGKYIQVIGCTAAMHLGGAILMLLAVLSSKRLQKIFSGNVLLKVGNVSLYIYMLHWTLLLSLLPALIKLFPWDVNYSVVIFSCCMLFAVVLGIMSGLLSVFDRKVLAGWLKRL